MLRMISRALVALALFVGPAAAQTFTLPELGLQNTGSCRQLAARDRSNNAMVAIGCLDTAKHSWVLTPSSVQITGSGSTGDVSNMSVTAGGTTRSLASWFPTFVSSASPTFTGTMSAPALNLTSSGSTGDISTMSAKSNVSGAVVRALNDRFAERISLKDQGAKGDGTTDDTAPFRSWLSAGASGAALDLPCGRYRIAGGPTSITIAAGKSLNIVGGGRECAVLYFSGIGDNQVALTLNRADKYASFHLRDASVTTDTASNSSTGIALYGPLGDTDPASASENSLTRVTFRGNEGPLNTNKWGVDFFGYLTSNIDFHQVFFFGSGSPPATYKHVGAYIVGQNGSSCNGPGGLGGACYAVQYSFNQCYFAGFTYGIQMGDVSQGFTVSGSNFNFGEFGIYAPSNLYALDGLSVTNGTQFNTNQAGIGIFSPMLGVKIIGTMHVLFNPNQVGLRLATPNAIIQGNSFAKSSSNTGMAGIDLLSGATNSTITGNTFSGPPSPNLELGILMRSGTSGNQVSGNIYQNVATNVTDQGTGNTVLDTFGGTVGQWKLKSSAPTTSDIGPSYFSMYKNTGDGSMKLCANDGGTIKCVVLQ